MLWTRVLTVLLLLAPLFGGQLFAGGAKNDLFSAIAGVLVSALSLIAVGDRVTSLKKATPKVWRILYAIALVYLEAAIFLYALYQNGLGEMPDWLRNVTGGVFLGAPVPILVVLGVTLAYYDTAATGLIGPLLGKLAAVGSDFGPWLLDMVIATVIGLTVLLTGLPFTLVVVFAVRWFEPKVFDLYWPLLVLIAEAWWFWVTHRSFERWATRPREWLYNRLNL